MKVDVLLGTQWGDEGKGKIVDVITPEYDVVARFQGGPNAGHTLEFNNIKHILHNIPSGIFRKGTINLIGNGVVLDPMIFHKEVRTIRDLGVEPRESLRISRKAHLILPTHRILDAASEAAKGKTKIGSTLKGIGPTYMDKTGRNGLRVGDILEDGFRGKYDFLTRKHQDILRQYPGFEYDLREHEKGWFDGIELLKDFELVDSEHLVNEYIAQGKSILAEGAQGTMLDIDFGSYPYVTSSNTLCAAACTGLGIAPRQIGEVMGIFKAYCTRVGGGPFPTEEKGKTGERLRNHGNEYGSTTGRPRRCGWLDLVVLRYSVMLNGITRLIMTKADVLSHFKKIKVCPAYRIGGKEIRSLPYRLTGDIQAVYTEMPSWSENLSGVERKENLPREIMDYIKFIEGEIHVPVEVVSVGADRNQFVRL